MKAIWAAGASTAEWVTATSTLVLAVFTIALVIVTGLTVLSAQRSYNADRVEAIEDRDIQLTTIGAQIMAQYRPTLIEVQPAGPTYPEMGARMTPAGEPVLDLEYGTLCTAVDPRTAHVQLTQTGVLISFAVRNVGFGMAIVDTESVRFFGPEIASFARPEVHRPRVPVGETARLDFYAEFKTPGITPKLESWIFYVQYTDYRGLQPTVAAFGLLDDPRVGWRIARSFQVEATLQEFLDSARAEHERQSVEE